MAEAPSKSNPSRATQSKPAPSKPAERESSSELARRDSAPLSSEKGQTTIADSVVTKVAGLAAREVPGVHALGGSTARAITGVTQRVGIGDQSTQGVSVEVGQREAAVDLTVVVDYGESIPQVADAVRNQVIKRVEGMTGLSVTEVNIVVNDLYFPGDEEPGESRVT